MKLTLLKTGPAVLFLLLLAGILFFLLRAGNTAAVSLEQTENPAVNPLKGFAAWGESYRDDPWISFAYIPMYWNLLEPEEGVYDFEGLEKRCHISQWRRSGVRLIFRIVTDSPSREGEMNIPEWLYEKMGGDGVWYDCDYGRGFSPDYENPVFREAHRSLLEAIALRYGSDPQTAFFQLGSLGHWGEWHVNTEAGIDPFPLQAVTDGYVEDYLALFPSSLLLLRRPYSIGAGSRLGLYNDSFGQEDSHLLWLSWIEDGYVSDQNGEALEGMPDFWKYAPSGGEFATDQPLSWYFSSEQSEVTLELLEKSHTTFLGPNAPSREEFSGSPQESAIVKLLSRMGYSLGIRRCSVTNLLLHRDLEATFLWENTGIAPMYQNWPVRLELYRQDGTLAWSDEITGAMTEWTPGLHSWTITLKGTKNLPPGSYRLMAGIIDPLTGKPGVALTMPGDSLMYEVCSFIL